MDIKVFVAIGDIISIVEHPSIPADVVGVKFRVTSVSDEAIGIEVADPKEAERIRRNQARRLFMGRAGIETRAVTK